MVVAPDEIAVSAVAEEPAGAECAPASPSRTAQVRTEREAAALDLADASQAAALSAKLSDAGAREEGRRLARVARRRYDSADRHRHEADRLEDEGGRGRDSGVEG